MRGDRFRNAKVEVAGEGRPYYTQGRRQLFNTGDKVYISATSSGENRKGPYKISMVKPGLPSSYTLSDDDDNQIEGGRLFEHSELEEP